MESPASSEDLFGCSGSDSDVTIDLTSPTKSAVLVGKFSDIEGLVQDSKKKEFTPSPEDASGPNKRLRPLCKYGEKCYRKNPAHLAEFRHPGSNKRVIILSYFCSKNVEPYFSKSDITRF